MNAIFFGLKRAHHSTLRITRPVLSALGLTAARYDMLFILLGSPDGRGWTLGQRRAALGGLLQSRLRKALGVSRPTVSRMLAALEELRLLTRRPCERDRRQVRVTLTTLGRSLIRKADKLLRRSGWAQLALDSALGAEHDPNAGWRESRWYDEAHCLEEMSILEAALSKVRTAFRDFASLDYRWRPDD
jgi:DNA-binding MarR family transcriptional regulator